MKTAGSQTINATDTTNNSITGYQNVTVSAAEGLNHFTLSPVATQTSGKSFNITITATDAYGNTITNYNGTPTLTVSVGSISPSNLNAFVNGTTTGQTTVTGAGLNTTITIKDQTQTGTSNPFTVNPTIIASAGNNGNINPSGTTTINYGSNQTFTITPNTGYTIASLTINGTSTPPTSNYTFTNVQNCQNITATFAPTTEPTPTPTSTITPAQTPTTSPAPTITPTPTANPTPAPTPTPTFTASPTTKPTKTLASMNKYLAVA